MIRCPRCKLVLSYLITERLGKYKLTHRQRETILHLFDGCQDKEIARRMGVKTQVVKNNLGQIYKITGASDRLELLVMVAFRGD